MMPSAGIVVVDRLARLRRSASGGALTKRTPPVELTPDEVFRRYRGFDGELWPDMEDPPFEIDCGLAAPADLRAVETYVHNLARRDDCDLILLARRGADFELLGRLGWSVLGFDVGFFDSEWSRFSVIWNEVVFGVYEELRAFAKDLNEHLLCSDNVQSERLVLKHNQFAADGKDVEIDAQIESIAICERVVRGPDR